MAQMIDSNNDDTYNKESYQIIMVPVFHKEFHEIGFNSVQAENPTAHSNSVKHHNRTLFPAIKPRQSQLKL